MKFLTSCLFILLYLVTNASFAVTISELAPIHDRPFLLPESDKQELLKLIKNKDWAKKDFDDLQQKAKQGDGYAAAFLFGLTENEEYFQIAKTWLLNMTSRGGDLGIRTLDVNDEFFKQGMPWLGDVFYRTNSNYLHAYDLIHNRLNQSEKAAILKGINASANFRQKSMDAWWQTANLVFKPTSMVAIAGLITQNPKQLNWGFFRKPGSHVGGYFSTLNTMLKDNGPWHEAPVYAIAHQPLAQSLKISNFLSTMTGVDWFNRKLELGSSVQGLMNYYIDTTYPKEIRPDGSFGHRILTYGDGATGQRGDAFLINQNSFQRNLNTELALAYKASKDPDYAAFLKLSGDYQPNLINRPELPTSALLPKAKSSLWSDFGLAFLRSDHSRGYWGNPDAIAASLLFRQGYGHGHADALSLTLFGGGKLFYPDYNAVQYENPAIGWTTSSVAHNTVVVDGNNSSIPKSVKTQHEFTDEFKFVQADIVEPLGLRKKRTLALSTDYLLDVFHVNSLIPRTYDYLLHSFGAIELNNPSAFKAKKSFSTRYKNIKDFKTSTDSNAWKLDFVIDLERETQNSTRVINRFIDQKKNEQSLMQEFGLNNVDSFRSSKIKLNMVAGENTQIGLGEDEYGLSFLAARRENIKQTTFASLHSPSYLDDKETFPNTIETLVDSKNGILLKVTTATHIDLHAIGYQTGPTILQNLTEQINVKFSGYAAIRINKKTKKTKIHGDWQGYFLPASIGNTADDISFGEFESVSTTTENKEISSIQVNVFPNIVVLKNFADSEFLLSLTNKSDKHLSAHIELEDNQNYDIPVKRFTFPVIPPFKTVQQKIILGRQKQTSGVDITPIKILIGATDEIIEHGIMVSAGPGLVRQFEGLDDPVYRVYTFDSTVDFAMRDGSIRQITDNQNNTVFIGKSLFDLSDGTTIFSPDENKIKTSYTWADQKNSNIITEINNLIRWHMFTIQNRFYIKLDEVYTRLDEVFFVFDKANKFFDWKDAAFLKKGNSVVLPNSNKSKINTNAVEIPFKNSNQSLCIKTTSTKSWINRIENLSFFLNRDANDQFGFGICKQGSLASWAN